MKKIFVLLSLLLLTASIKAVASNDTEAYLYMDALAKGSDKSSEWHNYTDIYSKYFDKIKDDPIRFMEIGIFKGDSVRLWENYFKNAELHFVDITLAWNQYTPKRASYHIADQSNRSELLALVNKIGGNFDVILDDGGHTMHQQLISFITLFPHVKPGGMYIIEDLHTSYWESLRGVVFGGKGSTENPKAGPGTFIHFLKDLIDDVNYVGARTQSASHLAIPETIKHELNIFKEQIYSLHFYDSVCVVIKR